jgi:hypothetical protein
MTMDIAAVRAGSVRHEGAVVLLQGAAVLHGLPCPWLGGWQGPLVLKGGKGHRQYSAARLVRRRVDPVDIVIVDGVRCTSPARTALELATMMPLEDSLVLLEAAGRTGHLSRDDLRSDAHREGLRQQYAQVLLRMRGMPGIDAARRAASLADPAAESAPESRARGLILRWGWPAPVVGHEMRGGDGRTYYVDLAWPSLGIVLEIDGATKYNEVSVLMAEKRREDALRETGARFFRAIAGDLWSDARVALGRVGRAVHGG